MKPEPKSKPRPHPQAQELESLAEITRALHFLTRSQRRRVLIAALTLEDEQLWTRAIQESQ